MRVETVSFVTRIRLPDGRHETTISMQNQHQKLGYEVTCDPKMGIVTIKSIKTPSWAVLIPMSNCTFITLGRPGANTKVVKSTAPRNPSDMPPMTPIIKPRGRKRVTKS